MVLQSNPVQVLYNRVHITRLQHENPVKWTPSSRRLTPKLLSQHTSSWWWYTIRTSSWVAQGFLPVDVVPLLPGLEVLRGYYKAICSSSASNFAVYFVAILCLTPRTTVKSLIASKNTGCKTHPLCINLGVPFWTRKKTHKFRTRWQASSSGICDDVTVVLEVRQSIGTGWR